MVFGLFKPPPSAEGVWGWVDTTSASQVKSATASNANISIANKANANTSVITKETALRLFCEQAKCAWQSIKVKAKT